jgi:NAD(P)-dependent dehydrogenase (short-subunit alcohol dehydrogenase family)
MQIKDSVVIITGGGSGLGAATAFHLAQLGAKICILDADKKAHDIAKSCDGIAFIVDVTQSEAVERALAQSAQLQGIARIVVNCAGIAPAKKIVGKNGVMPLENFQKVIDVNLIGTFNVLRLAAAAMHSIDPLEAGERGVIINTASIAAFEGQIGQTAYSASKAGIIGLTLPAARELASSGIRVMTIAPGLMETPMLMNMSEEVQRALQKNLVFPQRFGKPQEFASLVTEIIENPMLNGSVIRLDGGVHLS